jgi:hypothetical protein
LTTYRLLGAWQKLTDSGTNNGKVARNISRWQLNVGAEYDLDMLPGSTLSAAIDF